MVLVQNCALLIRLRVRRAWKLFVQRGHRALTSPSHYCTLFRTLTQINTMSAHNTYLNNQRISCFIRAGQLNSALQLFDEMPDRDAVSWNSIIAGYARSNSPQQAMDLFKKMVASGIRETSYTYSSLMGACSLHQGLQLHCRMISIVFDSNLFAGSALVDLYMRAESPGFALKAFSGLQETSIATCNAVLCGFCKLQLVNDLLLFFLREMRSRHSVDLNGVSFSYLIGGCCIEPRLEEGTQLHCLVTKSGWVPSNMFVSNALVDLYSAAGNLGDARRALEFIPVDDVISWNSMVSVCADNGAAIEALGFFNMMLSQGKRPSVRTFIGLISLSSRRQNLLLGVQIHGFVMKMGFDCGSTHLQSALIDMYGKCLDIESSVSFFNGLTDRSLESCNSLITAFLHCNLVEDTVEMLGLMIDDGITPDHVSLSIAVKALSSSTSLTHCPALHSIAVKLGVESNEIVSCSLINAYSRSGSIDLSHKIFERIKEPNLICFTTMIAAYARNGMGREGLETLDEMVRRGVKPDEVTFLCVLTGCDHSGMVDEARGVLESMGRDNRVGPDRRHFACMVSLLGRAGLVEEAMELARAHGGDKKIWSSVLRSCRDHGNKGVGRPAAEMVMELGPENAAACLEVSRFYSEIGEGRGSAELRGRAMDLGGREIGCSIVEVKGA